MSTPRPRCYAFLLLRWSICTCSRTKSARMVLYASCNWRLQQRGRTHERGRSLPMAHSSRAHDSHAATTNNTCGQSHNGPRHDMRCNHTSCITMGTYLLRRLRTIIAGQLQRLRRCLHHAIQPTPPKTWSRKGDDTNGAKRCHKFRHRRARLHCSARRPARATASEVPVDKLCDLAVCGAGAGGSRCRTHLPLLWGGDEPTAP